MEQQGEVRGARPNCRKVAGLDKIMMLNQVEKKALSLGKAHIDGATVTCQAMCGELSVA